MGWLDVEAQVYSHTVQRTHSWNEPHTMREPCGDHVPSFKIAARD